MPRTPRSAPPPARFPDPWLPVLAPARGPTAVATYLRAHLYGAAVGRSVLDRCISAVDPADRVRLVPLREEFEQEIASASRLLRVLSPVGTPGRRLVRVSSAITLSALPVGPLLRDPLARLAVLEALRTLVVAKRSMWELLAASWVADGPASAGGGPVGERDDDDELGGPGTGRLLLGLAEQARAQEELLEQLRRTYGLAVFE
ncbi:hypothetical protein [Dietzia sp. B32]|uniref:hypothetical protein n=1 Tax=Dietzia sp. B32 TaxID=2915130 RepID=UPI0021ADB3FF|nr:hypothetical protein [Dietzia sp. B32]UVE95693.1 hypothetical protein L8M95_02530 [Dietzia sp. B32]